MQWMCVSVILGPYPTCVGAMQLCPHPLWQHFSSLGQSLSLEQNSAHVPEPHRLRGHTPGFALGQHHLSRYVREPNLPQRDMNTDKIGLNHFRKICHICVEIVTINVSCYRIKQWSQNVISTIQQWIISVSSVLLLGPPVWRQSLSTDMRTIHNIYHQV
jgi:hypothetical protein